MMSKQILSQKDLKFDLQRQIEHVYAGLGTFIDSKLSKWNISKLQQQLRTKPTGVSAVGATKPESTASGIDANAAEAAPRLSLT